MASLKQHAKRLKSETYAVYLASRDPRVPWYAKVVIACIVAYALSPIDLIPDIIPVLGYLDDLILIPAGVALTIHLIPPSVMAECRAQAQAMTQRSKPKSWLAVTVIMAIWLAVLIWVIVTAARYFHAYR